MIARLTILALAASLPTGALAAETGSNQTSVAAGDSNEKICQSVPEIGSRLAKKRICATRAEWAERRAQDRADAEHMIRAPNGGICVAVPNNKQPIC